METDKINFSNESILIVDDTSNVRETLARLLAVLGFKVDSASDGKDALTLLKENEFTFLLTDMRMPEMDGLELIVEARKDFPDISIISMTGYSEGYKYIDVINAGANDFIKKPFDIEELEAKIRRIINERNLKNELSRLSITDSLTGLYNHRHFYKRLEEEVTRASRQRHPLALILIDLDNFKAYNDSYGHLAGDDILRHVGDIINKSIRVGVDSGYRYGGDEFAVILIEAGLNIAEEIGRRIQDTFKKNEKITVSIGYAKYSEGMSVKEIFSLADKNLYKSKTNKRKGK